MRYRKGLLERTHQVASQKDEDLPGEYQEELYLEEVRALESESVKANNGSRKILLVGGAGYIGSVVGEHFLGCGYRVRCLDMLLYANHRCVLPLMCKESYEFIYGDFVNPEVMNTALEGCTDVVILGGLVGDPITKKYPAESLKINEDATQGLVQLLNDRGLNKVIFVSTCSNYGLIPRDKTADENYPLNPLSLYAKSKVAMERALLGSKGSVDYHPTVLRFATAFGLSPRMRFDLTVNEFTREMYLNNDLVVFDADTWRPYCHVKDFAEVIRRTLEAPVAKVDFEVFNVGSAANNATKQMIVDKILSKLPQARIRYQEQGPDPRNYKIDFAKLFTALHFEPKHTIEDGIDEVIKALQARLFDDVASNRNFYGNYEINYKV